MNKAEKFITLMSGHQMFESRYKKHLEHFASVIETFGAKVVHKCGPLQDYDYSYMVENLKEIPKELMTHFGKAGLKTTTTSLSEKLTIIRLNA